jgi:hypothetical protein
VCELSEAVVVLVAKAHRLGQPLDGGRAPGQEGAGRRADSLSGVSAGAGMGIGLTKIKHVKLPVSDLQRSVSWYQSLLDLELHTEFVEEGIVSRRIIARPRWRLRDRLAR